MARIIGFEFLITPVGGAPVWVELQGSGGQIGAGALAALNDSTPAKQRALLSKVLTENLRRAQMEAKTSGAVRVWRDHDDCAKRITRTEVVSVDSCRAIYAGKMPAQIYECGRDNCPGTTGTAHPAAACSARPTIAGDYQLELANKIERGRAVGNEYVITQRPIGRTAIIARHDTREAALDDMEARAAADEAKS